MTLKRTSLITKLFVKPYGFRSHLFFLLFITLLIFGCNRNQHIYKNETNNILIDSIYGSAYTIEIEHPDSAIIIYQKGIDIADVSGNHRLKGKGIYYQGLVEYDRGNFSEAAELYTQAKYIGHNEKDTLSLLKVNNALGNLYNQQSRHQLSIEHFHYALDNAKAMNDIDFQLVIISNLGSVYNNTEEFDQSLLILKKGLLLESKVDNNIYVGDIYNNLSNNYNDLGLVDSAIDASYKALEIYKSGGNKKYESLALTNLTGYLLKLENPNYDLIDLHLKEIESLLKLHPDRRNELNYLTHLNNFYVETNELALALSTSKKLYSAIEEFPEKRNKAHFHNLLYRLYKKLNLPNKALSEHEQWMALRDSMVYQNNKERLQELQIKYESAEKEVQLFMTNELANKRKIYLNFAYIVGGLLIGVVAFLLYRSEKNKRIALANIKNLENQQKLSAVNFVLQGQEEERKRIAQDLHDGLGGLLTTVWRKIKLINDNLASKSVLVGEAETLISKACNEVRRISHDMMPASLVNLELKDALLDLIDESLINHDLKVSLAYQEHEEILSEKVKIHVYRVLQEIIQNTIKHSQAKKLKISLVLAEELLIQTEDLGRGFDLLTYKENGIGLRNIKSRVRYLDGDVHINSIIGKGTSYTISIPITQ